MRVAAVQIECRPGDIPANLNSHLLAVRAAQAQGAKLVVFPELSLTDYLSEPDIDGLARSADAAELGAISAAAGSTIVSVGFIERGLDGRVYNAQALLSGDGCLQVHRKVNLPNYGRLAERRYFAPGRTLELVPLSAGWNAATLICADTWNPALPWLAALQGADILIVPVASSIGAVEGEFDNPAGWDLNLRHTAMTYGLPLVMVNHCGKRNGLRFWGGSRILDAFGREVARAGEGSALIVADLDPADAANARQRLPTTRDANPDLVHAMLGRVIDSARR